jgi:hypothetical protein
VGTAHPASDVKTTSAICRTGLLNPTNHELAKTDRERQQFNGTGTEHRNQKVVPAVWKINTHLDTGIRTQQDKTARNKHTHETPGSKNIRTK